MCENIVELAETFEPFSTSVDGEWGRNAWERCSTTIAQENDCAAL